MRAPKISSTAAGVFLLLFGSSAMATPLQDMANIMLNLNHRPSAAEKQDLQKIIDNKTSTSWERTIATAIIHIDHHARPVDQNNLEDLMRDPSLPEPARELATIVGHINHHPSAEEKDMLRKMLE